eukprot:1138245-Pelagomonas_calceolata.AAC.7
MVIDQLPYHLFDHIFSFIDDTPTRDVTKWCLSTCNKELYLTLPVSLNTCFFDVQAAELSENCACMLLELNRIQHGIVAWSEKAAEHGWVQFLRTMYDKGDMFRRATQSIFVLQRLIRTRRMDIITMLHPDGIHGRPVWYAFEYSVQYGYLEMVKWLHDSHPTLNFMWFMETAAEFGHLDIVKYMHQYKLYSIYSRAIDCAAMYGHYEVLVYLHEHDIGRATPTAIDKAARNGYLNIVMYLSKNRKEGCTKDAMDDAASRGFLDIVHFLHENREEGCTVDAMNQAAVSGHMDVVKFLNERRTEGFTSIALEDAEKKGLPEIAAYLRQHGKYFRDVNALWDEDMFDM